MSISVEPKRIADLLRARDMTAADLSRQTGISEGAISTILSGQRTRPRADTLVRLAKALRTSVDYLTGQTDDPLVRRGEALPDYAMQIIETMRGLDRASNYELLQIAEAFAAAQAEASRIQKVDTARLLLDAVSAMGGEDAARLLASSLCKLEREGQLDLSFLTDSQMQEIANHCT